MRELEQGRTPVPAYASLHRLIQHILDTHHAYTRDELPRLETLLQQVIAAHGARHPELTFVQRIVRRLAEELMLHLLNEERILFPGVLTLETDAKRASASIPPSSITVQHPLRVMRQEHEAVGKMLRDLRSITSDYTAPADGCASFTALYARLQELEHDLHEHIHLENNILFPRALALAGGRDAGS